MIAKDDTIYPPHARCDHCEEQFSPELLTVLGPPAGNGELVEDKEDRAAA